MTIVKSITIGDLTGSNKKIMIQKKGVFDMNDIKEFFKNRKKDIKLKDLKLINKKLLDKNKELIKIINKTK